MQNDHFAVVHVISLSDLLCSARIHSEFPVTSAALPGDEAAPPADELLAAPACAAAISLTAHTYYIQF